MCHTTLLFVTDKAKKFNETVPCVTFDQPLYIKALHISRTANLNIVCRLSGFHTLMNFLGAVGFVMRDLLGLLYGCITVETIMSGKAFARAIRGHFIVHDALVQLLLQHVIGDNWSQVRSAIMNNFTKST